VGNSGGRAAAWAGAGGAGAGAGGVSSAAKAALAQPFIRIEGGALKLKALPDAAGSGDSPKRLLRVVAILGKARMGKSTFLNAVVAHALQGAAVVPTPFAMSGEDEHCTRGMDAYLLPAGAGAAPADGKNAPPPCDVLLLDCQGLALDDSSHDPALLLTAYLLADVLIFNERARLGNDTLKMLEPVATFASILDGGATDGGGGKGGKGGKGAASAAKPTLLFRVSDSETAGIVQASVDRILRSQRDQYNSLRDALRSLFAAPIGGIRTDAIERSHRAALQSGNGSGGVRALLADDDLHFADAAQAVLTAGAPRYTGREWCALVPAVLAQVNAGGRISLDRLDVVLQAARADMNEYVAGLPPALTAPLEVDATQATFEERVVPREAAVAAALADFDATFRLIGAELRTATRATLERRLMAPIEAAKEAATRLATAAAAAAYAAARAPTPSPLAAVATTAAASVAQQGAVLTAALAEHLRPLRVVALPLYKPVAVPLLAWAAVQETTLALALTTQAAAEKRAAKAVADACAVLSGGKPQLAAHLRAALRGTFDATSRADLLLPPDAVGTRVLTALVRAHRAQLLLRTWMSVEIGAAPPSSGNGSAGGSSSDGGAVRVVLCDASAIPAAGGGALVPRQLTEWSGARAPTATHVLTRDAAATATAAVEGYFARSSTAGGVACPSDDELVAALVAGQVSPTHGLLGMLARALSAHVVPAVRGATGPLAAELSALVESALAGVYEHTDCRGGGFVEYGGGDALTLLRRVQQVHPSLELVSVTLDSSEEAVLKTPAMVGGLLMTASTYRTTWETAFKLAAANTVAEGFASSADAMLRVCLRRLPADGTHPVSRVYSVGTTLPSDPNPVYNPMRHWAARGCGELRPQMFRHELHQVLARDDERGAGGGTDNGDDGERIFAGWRHADVAFSGKPKTA
jgi:hypothetical protein